MKKRTVLMLFLCFFLMQIHAQNTSGSLLLRSTIGVSGSLKNINIQNKDYIIQQSVGQGSVIGTFMNDNLILRQGFIQPDVLAKIADKTIPLNLEAVIYPNPFSENILLMFNEEVTSIISVEIYDIIGKLIFSKDYSPSQSIDVSLGNLPVSNYIIKAKANNKQFVKKIIKN
ncbi:MAG: hypothetical protein RL619_2079 [Bacteroidota bacterium]